MNIYEAKFARERKNDPTAWVIRHQRNHTYSLQFIGECGKIARIEQLHALAAAAKLSQCENKTENGNDY